MTRTEIKNNILYNENLVVSYQKSIREINSKINELNKLKSKYSSLQSSFSAKQRKRKNKFNSNFSGTFNVRLISSYISGMRNLLSGNEYKNAYNGLTTAIEKINNQIKKLQKQLNDYNDKLAYRKKRILYWKEQLKKVQQ